jgi:hypothetical protein
VPDSLASVKYIIAIPIEHTMNIRSFRFKGRRAEDGSGVGCLRPAQDLADKLARDCRSIIMSPWYRRIFRTRLAAHRNAVQEFITTTSLSCSAGSSSDRAIAARERALRLVDHTPLASRPVAIVEPLPDYASIHGRSALGTPFRE